MKKTILALVIVLALFFASSLVSVHAVIIRRGTLIEGESKTGSLPGQLRKEIREDILSGTPKNTGIMNSIKNFIFGARIQGTILSIGSNSLSEEGENGKTYQVNISANTKLIRRFGGKSDLAEFSVGNRIMVFGKYTDSSQTAINANVIRNLSIQKRWGAFFGNVTSLNGDNFIMKTIERGTQTVYFDSGTKFINRKEGIISYSDIKVGDRVRVKGIWDRTLNKITEVDQVKDFSLPIIKPTPTSSI